MFSQYGQDQFVIELLGGLRGGFFLDSGASDGSTSSNTRALEEFFDWTGICIEPNQSFFRKLIKARRCVCLNCCLYDRDGDVQFLEGARTLGGIVDEYDPGQLTQVMSRLDPSAALAVGKPARTVASILRECGAPKTIDYWSLDTEGSELAILKSFPFEEYQFRVLTVEHNWLPVRERIRAFLEMQGYQRISVLHIDDCYVRAGEEFACHARSRVWRSGGRGFLLDAGGA